MIKLSNQILIISDIITAHFNYLEWRTLTRINRLNNILFH